MSGRSGRRAIGSSPLGTHLASLGAEEQTRVVSDLWQELRAQLGDRIDRTAGATPPLRLPLGTWLRDDLLLEAALATEEVVRDAAALVGMPESSGRPLWH